MGKYKKILIIGLIVAIAVVAIYVWFSSNGTTPRVQNRFDVIDNNYSECSSNTYNCDDFKTYADAQRVFELCGGVDNDVHLLDRDGDGKACETLP